MKHVKNDNYAACSARVWDTFFFKWPFLLICNFSKSGDLNEEKVIDALIVLVFESTKVTQKGLIFHILKERSSYLQYFVTNGHLN